MKRLRFHPHYRWTLQMIGDEYGVTRERVRQIVGNSGHCYDHKFHHNRREYRDERVAGKAHPRGRKKLVASE